MERINCPFHEDDTPSLVIYPSGWYTCFGCWARGPVTKLGLEMPEKKETYVEDINPVLDYIKGLPIRSVRGLDLPADNDYYYLVWPSNEYFKRCPFTRGPGIPKYKGPSGIPKPLFPARIVGVRVLAIVEGEINALSIASVTQGIDIVSPGGASDFYSARSEKDLLLYKNYDKIYIIADKDDAGAIAAIKLRIKLAPFVLHIAIRLMEVDANEILVKFGQEALKEELKRMGLP